MPWGRAGCAPGAQFGTEAAVLGPGAGAEVSRVAFLTALQAHLSISPRTCPVIPAFLWHVDSKLSSPDFFCCVVFFFSEKTEYIYNIWTKGFSPVESDMLLFFGVSLDFIFSQLLFLLSLSIAVKAAQGAGMS